MKYKVRYWERTSVERSIEAASDAEARQKMLDTVAWGGIDLSFAELDDSGVDAEKASVSDINDIPELTDEAPFHDR